MARITDGDPPTRAANAAERARRDWLARAVRTHHIEVDRLLRRMNVPPERIELQVLPDESP